MADKEAQRKAARDLGTSMLASIQGTVSSIRSAVVDSAIAIGVLDTEIKTKINPLQLSRVGAVVTNLKNEGFSDQEVNTIVKAVFVTRTDADLKYVFRLMDVDSSQSLDPSEYHRVMKLIGEVDYPNVIDPVDADVFVKLGKQLGDLFAKLFPQNSQCCSFELFGVLMIHAKLYAVLRLPLEPPEPQVNFIPEEKPSTLSSVAGDMSLTLNSLPGMGTVSSGLGKVTGDSTASFSTLKVLDLEISAGLNVTQYPKVGRIIQRMQKEEYSDHEINIVVKSLFISQGERDIQKAFCAFDKNNQGFLERSSFEKTLPLLGEDVPPEKIQALFESVDSDNSGRIEFGEFAVLIKAMNPLDSKMGNRDKARDRVKGIWQGFGHAVSSSAEYVKSAPNALPTLMPQMSNSINLSSVPGANSFSGGVGKVAGGVGDSWSALKVLDFDITASLGAAHLPKVGRIVDRMQQAGFSNTDINTVIRALFISQSDREIGKSFRVFDRENQGHLERASFETTLPLLGEDVSESNIQDLFHSVDKDNSGRIELSEFSVLIKAMNPLDNLMQKREEARQRTNDTFNGLTGWFRSSASKVSSAAANASSISIPAVNVPVPGSEKLSHVANGASDSFVALKALELDITTALPVTQYPKVGRIIERMKNAGYSEVDVNIVIRAIFISQDEKVVQRAFSVFDQKKLGYLDRQEFEKKLPLLGEDVPADKIQELYNQVDSDNSGKIEFPEFSVLLSAMNPLDATMRRRQESRQLMKDAISGSRGLVSVTYESAGGLLSKGVDNLSTSLKAVTKNAVQAASIQEEAEEASQDKSESENQSVVVHQSQPPTPE
jgi:Ca2+-binding EF-hand superfamily protein